LEYDKLKLELSAFFNGSVPYDRLAPSERKKTHLYAKDANGNPYSPAWWTLNLKGSYAFNENFLLTFGVENLLDQRYRPYSSGITAPGINGMLALRISF
jgi:hemoglobin/transferrin/lactoferrin receptor protein